MRTGIFACAGMAAALWACAEQAVAPSSNRPTPVPPDFSAQSHATCPATPDVVVTTEPALRDALAAAGPGTVVGIDGVIALTADVIVTAPAVTLTCATPGSGLAAQPGVEVFALLIVVANGVTVDRLFLDGSDVADPLVADGVSDLHFTNSTVLCGAFLIGGSCALLNGTPGAVVSGNVFQSSGSFTGLHLQAGVDNSRIEDNTITTTMAGADVPIFGALRIRDGANVVVARNTVRGPWANSAALVDLAASTIAQNDFADAVRYGILTPAGTSFRPVAMTDNVLQSNRITAAGSAGILLSSACGNQVLGNQLEGNAGDVGLVFDVQTGANAFAGNRAVVIDNGGALDCDGDGSGDPNVLTGVGLARREAHGGGPSAESSAWGRLH